MTKKYAAVLPAIGFAITAAIWSLPANSQQQQQQQASQGPIKVENQGREVTVKDKKYNVSASRTKVMIEGKEAKREDLKNGMNCTISASGEEASMINCK